MSDPTEIVGHKTIISENGAVSHAPVTRSEADDIWKQIQENKAKREASMPDEQSAINAMCEAYIRLEELGWRHAMYAPQDGSVFTAITIGSSGQFNCHFSNGTFWIESLGDLWPSRVVMWKPKS